RRSIRKVLANRNKSRATKYSPPEICTCVVCGGENVGKTQPLASLTRKLPTPENFQGSTIACETYGCLWEGDQGTYRVALKVLL
ncbi:MAG: hypothetical protein P8Q54_07040, partial [Akkermansiaceae bacterium]|nr:hypothetical protein [Akkermansiaceae bacterium]MDG1363215.1 hypothetical protein [Akkermansiaceae bacterium]